MGLKQDIRNFFFEVDDSEEVSHPIDESELFSNTTSSQTQNTTTSIPQDFPTNSANSNKTSNVGKYEPNESLAIESMLFIPQSEITNEKIMMILNDPAVLNSPTLEGEPVEIGENDKMLMGYTGDFCVKKFFKWGFVIVTPSDDKSHIKYDGSILFRPGIDQLVILKRVNELNVTFPLAKLIAVGSSLVIEYTLPTAVGVTSFQIVAGFTAIVWAAKDLLREESNLFYSPYSDSQDTRKLTHERSGEVRNKMKIERGSSTSENENDENIRCEDNQDFIDALDNPSLDETEDIEECLKRRERERTKNREDSIYQR
jgi:hypothetical protein